MAATATAKKKDTGSGTLIAFESELNGIVKEYLEFCAYKKTANVFETEARDRGKAIKEMGKKIINKEKIDVQSDLLSMFHTGSHREFFLLWNDHVPERIRNNDPVCKKLEFYLNIYFAVYPIRKTMTTGIEKKGKVEQAMANFKLYLETRGSSLSQTTEFLPFYALPFVPDPILHPSFKELFKESWVPDLQNRLEKFLNLTLRSQPQPRLFEIYQDLAAATSGQIHDLQESLVDSEKKSMLYIKKFNKLQGDYHNLIGITAELVDSLENAVNGKMVTPEYLQTVCSRLFNNQLSQSIDLNRPATAASVLRTSVAYPSPIPEERSSQGSGDVKPPVLPPLDYVRIKEDVVNADQKRQALLLQALRWRLTRSQSGEQRNTVLSAYIHNDLLGCEGSGEYSKKVADLLASSEEVIRQYLARLINAFASLADGRTYLSHDTGLMASLQVTLQSEDKDSITRENVLGAMQKLSLKRMLQTRMIEGGMIGWLVSILDDNDSLSDYTLEYSVALLMNLCLRTTGKRKCAEDGGRTLRVLSDLLGHDNLEIRPYINGALYSILSIPSIKKEAKAMGMEEILKYYLKDDNPDMTRQIQFIIKQLNSDDVPNEDDEEESDDEDEDEDEEEQDAMEADLDKAEVLKVEPTELSGEKLLQAQYLDMKLLTQSLQQENHPLNRPITPNTHKTTRDSATVLSATPGVNGEKSRPPTRSGSRAPSASHTPRLGSASTPTPRTPVVKNDPKAQALVAKVTGKERNIASTTESAQAPKPSPKFQGKEGVKASMGEYSTAFSSRPRVLRSADGKLTPPQPTASDTLPLSRPGSNASFAHDRPASNISEDISLPAVGSNRGTPRSSPFSKASSEYSSITPSPAPTPDSVREAGKSSRAEKKTATASASKKSATASASKKSVTASASLKSATASAPNK